MNKKLASIATAALLVLAGCSSKTEPTKTTTGGALTGSVSTDGSTSMEKLITILGESFQNMNSGVKFSYNPTGSGSGIQAISEGRTDLGLSSRSLKDEEKAKGLEETVVAYDGIAIVVNPANGVNDLSVAQITSIFKGEVTNWKEVGGSDGEIVLIGREAGSGTRDGFESITKIKDVAKYRQELTSTGDVISTVSKNPNAIGYASLSAVKKDMVKTVTVEGIAPSVPTIQDRSYKISRPFVVVTKKNKKLTEPAQKFLDYITSSDANDLILKAGVVPVK